MNLDKNLLDYTETILKVPKKIVVESQKGLGLRLSKLTDFYRKNFQQEPEFFVRVPGRVNIIGEHVDYCGYPVLPMAISQSIILAVGTNESEFTIELRNFQQEKYPNYSADLNNIKIKIPTCSDKDWYNYYLCGIKGIFETLELNTIIRKGMQIALDGDIPPASGISSSSALVSSAVLATAYIQNISLECTKLANISAKCERYIGTQGGGMDQAIAYLAKKGCAQFIEFYPELKATSIELPTKATFVVANSLAEVNKAITSSFNERTVQCRLASNLIAHQYFLDDSNKIVHSLKSKFIKHFRELQEILECDLNYMEKLILKYIPNEYYTRSELCHIFEVTDEIFQKTFLTTNTNNMQTFKLKSCALHVIQETLRVKKFCDICNLKSRDNSNNGGGDQNLSIITKLSNLMEESHYSLKYLYECSHPNLDRLVDLTQNFGIRGVRLTGAGWGGCIIALCPNAFIAQNYVQMLKEKYYQTIEHQIREKYIQNDYSNVVFVTSPGDGAEILTLQ